MRHRSLASVISKGNHNGCDACGDEDDDDDDDDDAAGGGGGGGGGAGAGAGGGGQDYDDDGDLLSHQLGICHLWAAHRDMKQARGGKRVIILHYHAYP